MRVFTNPMPSVPCQSGYQIVRSVDANTTHLPDDQNRTERLYAVAEDRYQLLVKIGGGTIHGRAVDEYLDAPWLRPYELIKVMAVEDLEAETVRALYHAIANGTGGQALDLANDILDGHGLEVCRDDDQSSDDEPYADYVNMGDMDHPTLILTRSGQLRMEGLSDYREVRERAIQSVMTRIGVVAEKAEIWSLLDSDGDYDQTSLEDDTQDALSQLARESIDHPPDDAALRQNLRERFPFYLAQVNLDERGEFDLHVEDQDGNEVFRIHNDPEIGTPIQEMVDDGFMSSSDDIQGLADYLASVSVIDGDAEVYFEGSPYYPKAKQAQSRAMGMMP